MNTVYKIVKRTEDEDVFLSCYESHIPSKYVLEYSLGQKTIPKIGKIFAFKTLQGVKDYYNYCLYEEPEKYKIFECITSTKEFEELPFLPILIGFPTNLNKFWGIVKEDKIKLLNHYSFGAKASIPIGTVFVDDLTLIKEV